MHAALMHMYHTANVDMPEYFRAKLSQIILGMKRTISQDIQTGLVNLGLEVSPVLPYLHANVIDCVILLQAWTCFPISFFTM